MAGSWGSSWLASWGSSWGYVVTEETPAQTGGGAYYEQYSLKRRKKKRVHHVDEDIEKAFKALSKQEKILTNKIAQVKEVIEEIPVQETFLVRQNTEHLEKLLSELDALQAEIHRKFEAQRDEEDIEILLLTLPRIG